MDFGVGFCFCVGFTLRINSITRSRLCEGWKVGLELKGGERNGLITRFEISRKVEELICNATVRENAKKLRGKARECVSERWHFFYKFS
ncbi:hypothetical protein LINPERHAP2_LOCUS18406 [Linum perenne]